MVDLGQFLRIDWSVFWKSVSLLSKLSVDVFDVIEGSSVGTEELDWDLLDLDGFNQTFNRFLDFSDRCLTLDEGLLVDNGHEVTELGTFLALFGVSWFLFLAEVVAGVRDALRGSDTELVLGGRHAFLFLVFVAVVVGGVFDAILGSSAEVVLFGRNAFLEAEVVSGAWDALRGSNTIVVFRFRSADLEDDFVTVIVGSNRLAFWGSSAEVVFSAWDASWDAHVVGRGWNAARLILAVVVLNWVRDTAKRWLAELVRLGWDALRSTNTIVVFRGRNAVLLVLWLVAEVVGGLWCAFWLSSAEVVSLRWHALLRSLSTAVI